MLAFLNALRSVQHCTMPSQPIEKMGVWKAQRTSIGQHVF